MGLAYSSIRSMNYFFLRLVAKESFSDDQIIIDELKHFLISLSNEDPFNSELEEAIETELIKGSYFINKSESEARRILVMAITNIIGENLPVVVEFYISLAKKNGVFNNE